MSPTLSLSSSKCQYLRLDERDVKYELPRPILDAWPAERQKFQKQLCSAGLGYTVLLHLLGPLGAEEKAAIFLHERLCKDATHDEECSVKTLDTPAQIHNVLLLTHGGPKLQMLYF